MKNYIFVAVALGLSILAVDSLREASKYEKIAYNYLLRFKLATAEMNAAYALLTSEDQDKIKMMFDRNEVFYNQVRNQEVD